MPDGVGRTSEGALLLPLLAGTELLPLLDAIGMELDAGPVTLEVGGAELVVATLVLGVTPGVAAIDEFTDDTILTLPTDADDEV